MTPAVPWDHPREYGENGVRRNLGEGAAGSSPRIRGEFCLFTGHPNKGGIIPANTGRMLRGLWALSLTRDHPREYGENDLWDMRKQIAEGSSPRIRGEYVIFQSVLTAARIIPANTGRIVLYPMR